MGLHHHQTHHLGDTFIFGGHFFAASHISKVSTTSSQARKFVTITILPETNIAMENGPGLKMYFLLNMGIFHGYIASKNPARFLLSFFTRKISCRFKQVGIDCLESEALAIITDPLELVYLLYMNG